MAKRQIRPIRIEGNIAYIPLTQGYEAIIDAADAPMVAGRNWACLVAKRADGSIRSVYAYTQPPRGDGHRKPVYLHRHILGLTGEMQADHIDCDGLNNRRANLRPASHLENQRNCRLSIRNTSGVKGVYFSRPTRKWVAQIRTGGGVKRLGSYETIEAASAAYAAASQQHHGDFGRIA